MKKNSFYSKIRKKKYRIFSVWFSGYPPEKNRSIKLVVVDDDGISDKFSVSVCYNGAFVG